MRVRYRSLPLLLAGLLCLAAWLLPAQKPQAVLGRLSYTQFVAATLSTFLFVLGVVLTVCPVPARRAVAFRVAAVCLAVLAVLVPYEIACFLMRPLHLMDNPWYPVTGAALEAHRALPFVRPAHMKWEGLSRGDLAILNEDADPYARNVTFQTDHEGFHNSRDLTRADLIFLGDSFTEAGNVPEEESFVRLVAGELQMTARNLGRAGYSPPTELIVLREYGLRCEPRIVVWQIAESNDLQEAVRYVQWVSAGRPRYTSSDTRGQFSRGKSWQLRSPTFRLFASLRRPRPWEAGPSGTFVDSLGDRHPVRMLYTPDPALRPQEHPGFAEIERALQEGQRVLRARNIQLFVFLIPMKLRAIAPAVEFDQPSVGRLTSRGLEAPGWDVPAENTLAFQLKQRCDALGIPFADATPRLRESAVEGRLAYLAYDTHLSPEGHEVVSGLIVEAIRPR